MEVSTPFDERSPARAIIDNAPVPIWISGPDGSGIFFNKAWLGFTGQAPEDGLGQGWTGAIHPDDRSALKSRAEAFTMQQLFWTEFRLRRRDGLYRWMLGNAAPRFAADGSFLGYMNSCIDVTDRKESEVDLRRREDRLRFAVQHSPVMLSHCDRDLRYTWIANPYPHWPSSRTMGRRDDEILPPYQVADLIAFKRRVIETLGLEQPGCRL